MDELSPREISTKVTAIVCISRAAIRRTVRTQNESLKLQLNLSISPSLRMAQQNQRHKVEKSKLKDKVASSSHAWRKAKRRLTRKVQVKRKSKIFAKLRMKNPPSQSQPSPPFLLLLPQLSRQGRNKSPSSVQPMPKRKGPKISSISKIAPETSAATCSPFLSNWYLLSYFCSTP